MTTATNNPTMYDQSFYIAQQERSFSSAYVVLDRLFKFLHPKQVIDIGCGVGTWLRAASNLGVEYIIGIDGDYVDRSMLQISPLYFRAADLATESFRSVLNRDAERIFDLCICLEVAEHIPFERSSALVDDLTKTADTVLFSAAVPYQYGTGHINEQWPEFWAMLFRARGYSCFDFLRDEIWNHPDVDWWYAQNTLLFVKDGSEAADFLAQNFNRAKLSLARVHPENFITNVLILHRRHRLAAFSEEQTDYRALVGAYAAGQSVIPRLETVARASGKDDNQTVFPYTRTEISYPEQELAELQSALQKEQIDKQSAEQRAQILTARDNDLERRVTELQSALQKEQERYSEMEAERNATLHEKHLLAGELQTILSSTVWKSTLPIRLLTPHLPTGMRRVVRGVAKVTWWTLTLKLGQRLATRRRPSPAEHATSATGLQAAQGAVAHPLLTDSNDMNFRASETLPSLQQDDSQPTVGVKRGIILVIADILPLFDQASGGLRLKTIIDMMSDAGWSIVFGSFAGLNEQPGVLATPEGRARYEEALYHAGTVKILYGTDEIDCYLEDYGRQIRLAFLSFPGIAVRFIPVVLSYCPGTRLIYDMVDFHSIRLTREAALHNDPNILKQAEETRNIEIACAIAADITLAVTHDEKKELIALAPDAVVEVLPNIFTVPPYPLHDQAGRSGVFFVGGFWHKPNTDAVIWFVKNIFPRLRMEIPDLFFSIAGSNAGDDILALSQQPGVEVVGFVEDLEQMYFRHRVFVAPLRFGAGMKGKVGQSLAYGLPVVATPIGAEGMGLQNEVHLLVGRDEDEFVEQVLRLYRDDKLWSSLSTSGYEYIRNNYSVDAIRDHFGELLDG
ncbi:glycosyltransferase [Acidithiobacillus sp. AC3]